MARGPLHLLHQSQVGFGQLTTGSRPHGRRPTPPDRPLAQADPDAPGQPRLGQPLGHSCLHPRWRSRAVGGTRGACRGLRGQAPGWGLRCGGRLAWRKSGRVPCLFVLERPFVCVTRSRPGGHWWPTATRAHLPPHYLLRSDLASLLAGGGGRTPRSHPGEGRERAHPKCGDSQKDPTLWLGLPVRHATLWQEPPVPPHQRSPRPRSPHAAPGAPQPFICMVGDRGCKAVGVAVRQSPGQPKDPAH
jgi:hypothetical protein